MTYILILQNQDLLVLRELIYTNAETANFEINKVKVFFH